MAGTNLYWGHGEEALLALAQELGIPVFLNGLARGCVPADHELFFSRARSNGLKGADVALVIGVPMDFRLGFGQSFGEETELVVIDRAEPLRDHPRAGGRRALRLDPGDPRRAALGGPRRRRHGRVGAHAARGRGREARRRARRVRRRPRPAASDAPVPRARRGHRPRRDRDRRRRRLRLLRRARGRHLPAGLLAGPGAVRVPGQRARLRAGGQGRPPRPPGRAAARRRRLRLQRDGVRHLRAPWHQRRRRDGQQRHLGAREAPDGVPLRLLGRGRPAAGHALRPGRRRARRPRRARRAPRRTSSRALERAFSAGLPALVNVLTDPDVVYPRKSNLA